jgi:peroxidase
MINKGTSDAWIGGSQKAYEMSQKTNVVLTAFKKMVGENKMTALSYGAYNLKAPYPYCVQAPIIECGMSNLTYRTIDGSCNNQNNTWWGRSETPLKRLVPAAYDDYVNEPRQRSVVPKKRLPNARQVALKLFQAYPTVSEWSHFMTYFGQFLDHDLSLTAQSTYSNGFRKYCQCNSYDPDCFNIAIPYGDYANSDQQCMSFVRSMSSMNDFHCNLGPRAQLNVQTAWVDLSQVYGYNYDVSERLRTRVNGTLKSSIEPNGEFLPPASDFTCSYSQQSIEYSRRSRCYHEGDPRAEDNSILTSIHTLFLREHNRIARALAELKPCWDDETVFFQARNIMIAQYQNIVYGEFLPALLGPKLSELYSLLPLKDGYFKDYSPNLYPQVINEFSTAAFRYGHTLITHTQHTASSYYKLSDPKPTSYYLFNNQYYKTSMDGILRGTLVDWSYAPKTQVNEYLKDWLFNGLFTKDSRRWSLPALNIQRGRDHGLPGYNKYRELCGLNRAYAFEEFHNMPKNVIAKLKAIYASPDDVDLFAGLFSEFPLEESMVGATAGCKP